MNNIKKEHTIEIIGLIISIFISIILFLALGKENGDIGIFATILSVWIFYAIILIKIHINSVKKSIIQITNFNNKLIKTFFDIDSKYILYGKEIIDNTVEKLESVKKGIVPLTEQEYYERITKKSQELTTGDEVISVNTIDVRRFLKDGSQNLYLIENIEAVKNYNVDFTRIFIIDTDLLDINPESKRLQKISEGEFRNKEIELSKERIKAIKENFDGRIKVRIVDKKRLGKNKKTLLVDGVLFKFNSKKEKLLYVDEVDKLNPLNVEKGELRLSNKHITKFEENFYEKLLKLAESEKFVKQIIEQI